MKKTLFSILTISTLLFNAACGEKGTSTEVATANEDEDVNPNHIRGYGDREPGGANDGPPEPNQMYAFDTDALSAELRNDLGVEGDMATEIVRVYYDQNRQLSELKQQVLLSDTARMGGQATEGARGSSVKAQQGANTAAGAGQQRQDQEAQRKQIQEASDRKVKEMLTPEQYKKYQQNRTKYHDITQQQGGETEQPSN